jgi:hypothetical protein
MGAIFLLFMNRKRFVYYQLVWYWASETEHGRLLVWYWASETEYVRLLVWYWASKTDNMGAHWFGIGQAKQIIWTITGLV